jgi:hypothetical protein
MQAGSGRKVHLSFVIDGVEPCRVGREGKSCREELGKRERLEFGLLGRSHAGELLVGRRKPRRDAFESLVSTVECKPASSARVYLILLVLDSTELANRSKLAILSFRRVRSLDPSLSSLSSEGIPSSCHPKPPLPVSPIPSSPPTTAQQSTLPKLNLSPLLPLRPHPPTSQPHLPPKPMAPLNLPAR